ncbi:MAG: hypothetical protein GKS03_14585 [Alphaproteobacteria bacterium]|nr:hypothetical protein [Alphaproteobacteria bacterium]
MRPLLSTVLLVGALSSTVQAQDSMPTIDVRGLVDARLILTDNTVSWEERGLGKTRWGGDASGDNRVVGRIAEASLIFLPKFSWDWSGVIHVKADSQQHQPVDVIEAFLRYKPVPKSDFRYEARIGAFFPPISLENKGIAWTSPYTITSSAINSWVGEELKTLGAEFTVSREFEDFDLSLTGSAFTANDPAGTLLAWRGWALHDREAGLFEQLPLAPIRTIEPGGEIERQAPWVEPFHQIDTRIGGYAGITVDHYALGRLSVLYYDNQSFDRAFDGFQYAWDTYFVSAGYENELPGGVELISQMMIGNTSMGTRPLLGSKVNNDYWSIFTLLSKRVGKHRFSFRYDHFEVADDDLTGDDLNQENGNAWTAAYVLRPFRKQRLTLEVLHVDSKRPEREFLNLPVRARETTIQASYRFFL